MKGLNHYFVVVQSQSRVQLFVNPCTAAWQASLSFATTWSLLKLMFLSWWWHPTISFSVIPFSSCPQSFPASGSFPMSWLFSSHGQNYWSFSISPSNEYSGWFPLGLTALISLLSKGLSRVFSNTTVCRHEFFSGEPSLWSNSHIHTWLLEKP